MLRPGGTLLVEEFDVERFDERAAEWWLEQRRARGAVPEHSAQEKIAELRAEIHPLSVVQATLEAHFDIGPPFRGSYLYRWDLDEALRLKEDELIVEGVLPAVGARLIGRRRAN